MYITDKEYANMKSVINSLGELLELKNREIESNKITYEIITKKNDDLKQLAELQKNEIDRLRSLLPQNECACVGETI